MSDKISILAVGDTVVDDFIKLSPDHAKSIPNSESGEDLIMKFGDKIPFENNYVLYGVGNSANAAVSISRLGHSATLLTHLGDDDNGRKCMETLEKDGVNTSHITSQSGLKTNYHFVLWLPPERTILVKHELYHYDFATEITGVKIPDFLYLSSIGSHTEQYHDDIADWLDNNPSVRLLFQPGTFQMELGAKRLERLYKHADLFVCNLEEAERILEIPEGGSRDHSNIKQLLIDVHALGPNVVVLTDGPDGAYSYDGTTYRYCPMYPDPAPPIERTGAGDAYASCLSAYYAEGLSLDQCMLRAPINSMNVVQHIGAQKGLLTRDEIEEHLQKAPPHFKISMI